MVTPHVDYVRFNTEDFPQHVQVVTRIDDHGVNGLFSFPKVRVPFKDITSVWYRRPVPPTPSSDLLDPVAREFVSTESQATLDGIWESLDCFWVSRPDRLRRAEIKIHQLGVAARLGFHLPPTTLTNSPAEAEAFYWKEDGQVIYKPLRRARLARGKTVSLIYTSPIGRAEAQQLSQVAYAPTLLQRYIPKHIEIRATVIGTKVFAVEVHSQESPDSRHDWRRGDIAALHHEPHGLPPTVAARCVALVEALGLAFGAIDLILTPEGDYVFLEINPNGQWAWLQQLCPSVPLREALADLLIAGRVSDGA